MRKFTVVQNREPQGRVAGFVDLAAQHVVEVPGPSIPLLCDSQDWLHLQAHSNKAAGFLGIISRYDKVKWKKKSLFPWNKGASPRMSTPRPTPRYHRTPCLITCQLQNWQRNRKIAMDSD